MKKQEMHGRMTNLQGRVMEAAGIVAGNHPLERKGARKRADGAAQQSVGKARRKIADAVDGVAAAIRK